MTKPKHKFSRIFLSLIIPFFSLAFLNSSFFKVREIKIEGLNDSLEGELRSFKEGIIGENLLFLNLKILKEKLGNLPFLEIESFQKLLPNKLIIKFKVQEELGTLINPLGVFDLYKGGYIFPRFKEGQEKILIQSPIKKEILKELAEILEENPFIYEYFYSLKILEGDIFEFVGKGGYSMEVLKRKDIPLLKESLKITQHCPIIFNGERVSFLNYNFFIASK
ncbi:MAG: hypothetical protein WHV67_00150 [Thermoanaerobaculia bacterium]